MTEQIEQTIIRSGIIRRICALLIDLFINLFLIIILSFGPLISTGIIDGSNFHISIMAIIMFLTVLAKDSIHGISIGRWTMGIMVRKETDLYLVPSFGKLLLRNLFIAIWPVELIVLLISNEKKRLGDKTAKTIVVENKEKVQRPVRVLTLIALIIGLSVTAFYLIADASLFRTPIMH